MVFPAQEQIPIPTKNITSWYFDDPQCDPDTPIYMSAEDPSKHYTHRQAKSIIRKLIAGFRAHGLQQGDCVCIHSFNDYQVNYPIVVNGIVGFGGIFSGTNPSYQPYELAHAVKAARVKFFIVEPEILQHALAAAKENGIPQSRILIFDNRGEKLPDGFKSWRTLLEHGEEDWVRFDDLQTAKNTTAARLFSSGTTGLPKAAIMSHYNFIAQHCQINEWQKKPYEQKRLMALPIFHVAAAPSMHFSPLRNGVPTYILRRFELEAFLSSIQRYQISDLAVVPPIAIQIIMSDKTKNYSLKSIKMATCGAAPLDKGPQARLKALISEDAPFTQVWGMTETTCIATMFPYPEQDFTGSVGRPVPGLDIKLVDDAGTDITDYGVRGELCVRGPTVIAGYLDNAEATAASWDADGFFHTGDVAYCDAETQKWYIVDRKKELIKVRGFQVAPPELEAVLLSHPHIVDAAVIGVTGVGGDNDSEYPRAYVTRRAGDEAQKLTADDVKTYMAERLAGFKRLVGGVVFVDAVPRNPSGKILKRTLRERAVEELKKEQQGERAKL